jgi:hypothetical protein
MDICPCPDDLSEFKQILPHHVDEDIIISFHF